MPFPREDKFRPLLSQVVVAERHCLEVASNQIRELPASLGRLTYLEDLDLTDNRLEELPKNVAVLPKLKTLKISGNLIEVYPQALFQMHPTLNLEASMQEDDHGVHGDTSPEEITGPFLTASLQTGLTRYCVAQGHHFHPSEISIDVVELSQTAKECSSVGCKGIFIEGCHGREGQRFVRFTGGWDNSVNVAIHTCHGPCTMGRVCNCRYICSCRQTVEQQ